MLDLPVPELLKLPVLKTQQAAKVMNMSPAHFCNLVSRGNIAIKPLPYSHRIKYWSTSDLKKIIDGNNAPSEIESETAELLRAFNGQN